MKILAILNVTPDSFYDGGRFDGIQKAIHRAYELKEQGADFIDIGGESTRPGSEPVSVNEELDRIMPVIEKVAKDIPVSVDTKKAAVMKEVLKHPVQMINDVNAFQDQGALDIVSAHSVKLCMMHMQGNPQNMQNDPSYENVTDEVISFFEDRLIKAKEHGIHSERIIIDPGFGFGKTLSHNYQLMNELHMLKSLHCDILVGTSRKSMVGNVLHLPAEERLNGSIVLTCMAIERGARYFRVHDVVETKQAFDLYQALRSAAYV